MQSRQIVVHAAETAEKQLAIANQLALHAGGEATEQDRLDGIAEAWTNYEIISKVWPDDADAVVLAALGQHSLAFRANLRGAAVSALANALPAAKKTRYEPEVEEKLAMAYENVGRAVDAEEHYLAAERSLHRSKADVVRAASVLGNVGRFYAHHGAARDAIKYFKAGADWPGQSPVARIQFQLQIAKYGAKLSDDPDQLVPKTALSAADQLISEYRGKASGHGEAEALETVAREAKLLRTRLGL